MRIPLNGGTQCLLVSKLDFNCCDQVHMRLPKDFISDEKFLCRSQIIDAITQFWRVWILNVRNRTYSMNTVHRAWAYKLKRDVREDRAKKCNQKIWILKANRIRLTRIVGASWRPVSPCERERARKDVEIKTFNLLKAFREPDSHYRTSITELLLGFLLQDLLQHFD